jgi:hypothetical protein
MAETSTQNFLLIDGTKLTGVHSGSFHSTDNHAVFNEQHVISELKHYLPGLLRSLAIRNIVSV